MSLIRHNTSIVIASSLVLLAILLVGCRKKQMEQVEHTMDRKDLPSLTTDSITTLISDSGITRYRIESPQWLIYDKKDTPYQEFPHGIYMEQFDEQLRVKASLKADYAHYDETSQIWHLRGNVHALNRKGEQFDTPELNWNQKEHKVYSDTTIHITREKSIITGVGFDSNEEMNKYTILQPTGVFPIKEEDEQTETKEEQPQQSQQPKQTTISHVTEQQNSPHNRRSARNRP